MGGPWSRFGGGEDVEYSFRFRPWLYRKVEFLMNPPLLADIRKPLFLSQDMFIKDSKIIFLMNWNWGHRCVLSTPFLVGISSTRREPHRERERGRERELIVSDNRLRYRCSDHQRSPGRVSPLLPNSPSSSLAQNQGLKALNPKPENPKSP